MRRIHSVVSTSTAIYDATVSRSSFLGSSCQQPASPSTSSVQTTQVRLLRNLHKKRQERNKSLVKNRHMYSRKWFLEMGDNHELVMEKGHEREAFENFFRYRTDWGTMTLPRYVSDPKKLPPKQRYDLFYNIVQDRKGLSAYLKNKYLLEALECFVEMKALGEIKEKYDDWQTIHQNHFLYCCDQIVKNSSAYSKVQHSAVASVIRAAAICDEVGCTEKRNMCLNAAEFMAKGIDSHYFFKREKENIPIMEPWKNAQKVIENKNKIQEQFERDGKIEKYPGKAKDLPNFYTVFKLNAYPVNFGEDRSPNFAKPLQRNLHQIK